MTRWPGVRPAAEPAVSMTPTTSWPGRYGSGTNGWRPWAACRSDPHTPATSVRTRASSGPGAGMSAASTAIRPG